MMKELFLQTSFLVGEQIEALDKGEGPASGLPPCLLMNELGVKATRGNKTAETYLREKMLTGLRGAEGRFLALCYLSKTPQLEPATQAELDRVQEDSDPEIQAIVAKAIAAIG